MFKQFPIRKCAKCFNLLLLIFAEEKYIVVRRRSYLEKIRQYRAEGRPIFYMDESYCKFANFNFFSDFFFSIFFSKIDTFIGNANYTPGKMWHDFSISSMIEVHAL